MEEEEARKLVQRHLHAEFAVTGVERISKTWVVSWESRKFIETGDVQFAEIGPRKQYLVSDAGRITGTPNTIFSRSGIKRKPILELVAEFEGASVHIDRKTGWPWFRFQAFTVELDGSDVQTIGASQSIDLPTSPGEHRIRVRFRRVVWSDPVVVTLSEGDECVLECDTDWGGYPWLSVRA
jgi:hypothetical protein